MDSASPISVSTAAKLSSGYSDSNTFTFAHTFKLAEKAPDFAFDWLATGRSVGYRGAHHPRATGDGL